MEDAATPESEPTRPSFAGYPTGCPPADAEPASGPAFRVLKHDDVRGEDFLSLHEQGIEPKPKTSGGQLCRRRSLSVYLTIDDARQHIKKYPGHGWKRIAARKLSGYDGLTKLTPNADCPTHTEWWCADGVNRIAGFVVVE